MNIDRFYTKKHHEIFKNLGRYIKRPFPKKCCRVFIWLTFDDILEIVYHKLKYTINSKKYREMDKYHPFFLETAYESWNDDSLTYLGTIHNIKCNCEKKRNDWILDYIFIITRKNWKNTLLFTRNNNFPNDVVTLTLSYLNNYNETYLIKDRINAEVRYDIDNYPYIKSLFFKMNKIKYIKKLCILSVNKKTPYLYRLLRSEIQKREEMWNKLTLK